MKSAFTAKEQFKIELAFEQVNKIIKRLNVENSTGPDKIPGNNVNNRC